MLMAARIEELAVQGQARTVALFEARLKFVCGEVDVCCVRSTSNMQWTWALVRRDSIMRCAMMRRMFVIGTRSPGMATGVGRRVAGAGAATSTAPVAPEPDGTLRCGAGLEGRPYITLTLSFDERQECLVWWIRPGRARFPQPAKDSGCQLAGHLSHQRRRSRMLVIFMRYGCRSFEETDAGFGSPQRVEIAFLGAAGAEAGAAFFSAAGAAFAGAAPSPSEIVPTTVFT